MSGARPRGPRSVNAFGSSPKDNPAWHTAEAGDLCCSEIVLSRLLASGIDTFFTNPGTSELGLIDDIGRAKRVRAVPVLHEGIAAGAANGRG